MRTHRTPEDKIIREALKTWAMDFIARQDLKAKGLDASDGDLRGVCVRLQQELPRAWLSKYGQGNTEFFRFDEAEILLLESCFIPGRHVGPRNAQFIKWHEQDGLGAARIAKRWNGLPERERRSVAPKASAKVTDSAVKKVVQRDPKRKD